MTTRVIFNTDKKLKAAAMRKAKRQGLTYSAVLNLATRAYVNNDLKIDLVGEALERGREDVRQGRIYTEEEVRHHLGLKPYRGK